jgi:Domain of unknown function (DUF397)
VRSSDFPHAIWRKSSRSNDGSEGDCVEVALLPDQVAMRDSKDPAGPSVALTCAHWQAFLSNVRAGDFG